MAYKSRFLRLVTPSMLLGLAFGVGPSFRPDRTVKGFTLAGWRTVGPVNWKVENGLITGTPRQDAGGILMLDESLQDVGFYAAFRCVPGCRTGILMRLTKSGDGMKGVYISLTDPSVRSYKVNLNAQGQIVD